MKYFRYTIYMQIACVALHYGAAYLKANQNKNLSQVLMCFKCLIYQSTMVSLQRFMTAQNDDQNREALIDKFADNDLDHFERRPVLVWLVIKIMMFYVNIFSIIILMLITKCVRFKTIRERINMADRDIKNKDYLLKIEKDIHWFQIGCLMTASYCIVISVNVVKNE